MTKNLRVLFATYPSVMLLNGGPKTQILQTKAALEKIGVSVTLFNSWESFREEDFDIVHLFGANIGNYHLAREFHKLGVAMAISPIFFSRRSAPIIRTVVAIDGVVRKLARGTWSDFGISAEICRWAQLVLPNTSLEARVVQRGLGVDPRKIRFVPNGVESRFAQADPKLFEEKYGIKNFVLNVGHVGPERKNVFRLIQALEKVNVPSVIIGRIEDNEYGHKCVAEAKRNPRLTLIESLPNDAPLLASAYAACDVFALPSYYETPGIAALEAGLAGAKIAITRGGGTEEYFGADAEYVEPTSWELIHHGILTALNKPKSPALRERIQREYLWEKVGEKTLEAYTSSFR
jgi:glycosyltransferase involved in cell wall biosynthesis